MGENISAYPELGERRELIEKSYSIEEEAFGKAITGLALLDDMLASLDGDTLSGADAFKPDTYGFPLDLTSDILAEKGIKVDEEEFNRLMTEQRDAPAPPAKCRRRRVEATDMISRLVRASSSATTPPARRRITAIVKGSEFAESLSEGESAAVILDVTPFYGKAADRSATRGRFQAGTVVQRSDTANQNDVVIHIGTLEKGELRVGDTVLAKVSEFERLPQCATTPRRT